MHDQRVATCISPRATLMSRASLLRRLAIKMADSLRATSRWIAFCTYSVALGSSIVCLNSAEYHTFTNICFAVTNFNEWSNIASDASVPHTRVGHAATTGSTNHSMLVSAWLESNLAEAVQKQLGRPCSDWCCHQALHICKTAHAPAVPQEVSLDRVYLGLWRPTLTRQQVGRGR